MANARSADVIIVGAGIMGVSTAYHLARRQAGRIVVLERDDVCSGSTALASGGIRHQYANRIGVELTRQSIVTYERFAEEFGVDPHFRQHGYLILDTTEAEQAQAERNVDLQRSLGVDVRLLTPDETRKRFPYLATDDLRGATYSPRDGYADPYLATTAIAARARELGVTIRTGCEVSASRASAIGSMGVVTRDGAVTAPVVVVATGAWSGVVGKLAGVDIPVMPLRRSKFITAPFPFDKIPEATPFVIDPHLGISLRREGAGILLGIGRRAEAGSFSTVLDWSLAEPLVERAVRRAPVLEDAQLMRTWTGPLRDDAGSDGDREHRARRGRPARHRRLQRPRLHARAHRRAADGRADRRRPREHARHRRRSSLERFARGEANVESLTFT